jgi:hypothetical protein
MFTRPGAAWHDARSREFLFENDTATKPSCYVAGSGARAALFVAHFHEAALARRRA